MLKAHGFRMSQPSRSVLLLLEEAGVEHEWIDVDIMKGESRTEEFLKINPMGQVPAIQEDDFNLAEGGAILSYIAKSRGLTDWLPVDPNVRAKVNFWIHWNHTNTRKSTTEVLMPSLTGTTPELAGMKAALDFLEARLGESGPFLAGTEVPTIADLFILPEVDQVGALKLIDLEPWAKVSAWQEAMQKALPKSYESNIGFVKDLFATIGFVKDLFAKMGTSGDAAEAKTTEQQSSETMSHRPLL